MGVRKDGGKMIRKILEGKAKNVGKNYLLKIFLVDKFLLIGDRKGKPKGRITKGEQRVLRRKDQKKMAQLKRMLVEAEERMEEKEQCWKKQEMKQIEREKVGERIQILDEKLSVVATQAVGDNGRCHGLWVRKIFWRVEMERGEKSPQEILRGKKRGASNEQKVDVGVVRASAQATRRKKKKGLYVSGARRSAQAVWSTARPRQSYKSNKRQLTFFYLGSSKLGSCRPGARPSHVPHHSPHRVNRRMRQWPRITEPQVTVIKVTISAIRPIGGNHDHRNSAEVTAHNPAGISITPSEIGGSSSSHGRHSTGQGRLFSPMLRHSARLATDLSVGVSPRRAHSAGFAGQVGRSGASSHVGQARLKGIRRLGRLGSVWREAPQRSPRLEPSYVTITVTFTISEFF
ncbi:hypothetical protein Taro_014160 [Colocasia esculenta]|uniref:Uncharacterized protein n=1 Tax=Colocasia esculenta TaxID=4460 RepID=A0A843UIL4_COLES|nr:hypothetical protein [Colocasia esculenta]